MNNKFSVASEDVQTPTQGNTVKPWTSIRRPAVQELAERQRRLGNFGVALYVISQAIPYFVLMNVRWMMTGSYIPPDVNRWLGGFWPTLFLALGTLFIWLGVRAIRAGRAAGLQWSFIVSVVLGVAATATFIIPLRVHSWDIQTHYGSIYAMCLGVAAFYTAITTILVLGVVFRTNAGLVGPRTLFGPQSVVVVWTFNAVAWFALCVVLYLF